MRNFKASDTARQRAEDWFESVDDPYPELSMSEVIELDQYKGPYLKGWISLDDAPEWVRPYLEREDTGDLSGLNHGPRG